jgi:hypothetical protein
MAWPTGRAAMPAQLVSDALANATAATQPAEGGPTGHRALTWPAGWAHPDRTRTRGWGVLGGLAQAGACVQPVQPGAHQVARPSSRIAAGSSAPRMSVASSSTASGSPTPNASSR